MKIGLAKIGPGIALVALIVSGCAGVETRDSRDGDARYFHSQNPEMAIVAEADEFNFDYEVADLEGRPAGGQVFDDGGRTYFLTADGRGYQDLKDAAGQKRETRREGLYRVTEGVEAMWFARDPSGRQVCIRAGWMGAGACQDAIEASKGVQPDRAALEHRREELMKRLEALENNGRQE